MKRLTEKLTVAVMASVLFAAVSYGADAKPKNLLKDWSAKKPLSKEIKVKDSASQNVVLNQKVATPITISAESRCDQ